MNRVLGRLRLEGSSEDDPECGAIGRHQSDVIIGLRTHSPTENLPPELRQAKWIVGIKGEVDESRSHRSHRVKGSIASHPWFTSGLMGRTEVAGSLRAMADLEFFLDPV